MPIHLGDEDHTSSKYTVQEQFIREVKSSILTDLLTSFNIVVVIKRSIHHPLTSQINRHSVFESVIPFLIDIRGREGLLKIPILTQITFCMPPYAQLKRNPSK